MRCVAVILGAALAGAAPSPSAAGPAGDVTRWNVGAWTVWRVDRPGVARAARSYDDIRFQPGDRVLVDAGGCLARGTLSIPGATAGLVPVAAVLRRELRVEASGAAAVLRLGRACAGSSDGWLMVGAQHATADEPLPLPRPMDLVSNGLVDQSGIALNPKWGLQQTEPGTIPDPVELCFDVPGWFDNPICTVQRPSIDTPVGAKGLICGIGATTPINGHVNWFASTYEGPIFWEEKFWSDQDYNVLLVPPDQNGLTTAAGDAIQGEFDGRETVNHFVTPWWKDLRRAANLGLKAKGRALMDGRPAVITGLLGVDCEHGCSTELHPVWLLGVQAAADATRETWALFARNWGNEGFCSSAQHHLELAGNRLTVTVPWREGATGVRLGRRTKFFANLAEIRGWWTPVAGRHVVVTFQLPPPDAHGRIHGELVLVWSGGSAAAEPATSSPRPQQKEDGGDPEALIEELIAGLTPAQRTALALAEPRAETTLDEIPVKLERGPPTSAGAQAAVAPSVRSVPDPGRDADDLRRLEALVKALGGALPGALQDLPRILEERTPQ
jgi:hypothetical protein